MSQIAKGSKSKLLFAPETSFGVPNTGVAYKGLLFSTESLVEQIDTFKSQDIRPDRQQPAVRGGNIMCGGSVTSDFAIRRHALFLQHLLAISAAPTANAITPTALTNSSVWVRGDYMTVTPTGGSATVFVCKIGGTYTQVTSPSADFVSFTSGDLAVGGVTWQFVGVGSSVYHYALTPSIDFPTVGIGFEKQVLGGASNLYVLFQGGRIDSLALSITQKEIVKATWVLEFLSSVAGSATQAAPSSIVLPTDDPVSGYDSFISLNGGVTTRPLKDCSLDIKNNIEKDVVYLGNRVRSDLPEGMREISGKFQTFFQDMTEYNLFKQETTVPIVISIMHNGELIKFTLGEVKITGSGTPQISGHGTVSCSFDFTVFVQSGTHDMTVDIYSTSASLYS